LSNLYTVQYTHMFCTVRLRQAKLCAR